MSQASLEESIGRRRAQIIELAGPAGAGKTSVTSALLQLSTKVVIAPDISLRNPEHMALLALSVSPLLSLLRPYAQASRRLTWDEIKSIAYLSCWPRLLGQQAANTHGAILVDQGPIFRLAALHAFGPRSIRRPSAAAWWNKLFKAWAPVLDLVIWLDAPNPILEQRINARDRWHLVKGKPGREVSQFLDRYRMSYHHVLARLRAEGTRVFIPFDTSQVSAEQVASAVLIACKLESCRG